MAYEKNGYHLTKKPTKRILSFGQIEDKRIIILLRKGRRLTKSDRKSQAVALACLLVSRACLHRNRRTCIINIKRSSSISCQGSSFKSDVKAVNFNLMARQLGQVSEHQVMPSIRPSVRAPSHALH